MGFKNNIIKLIGMVIVCLIIVFIGRSAISKNYGGQAPVLDYICFMVGGPKYIPENMVYHFQAIPQIQMPEPSSLKAVQAKSIPVLNKNVCILI